MHILIDYAAQDLPTAHALITYLVPLVQAQRISITHERGLPVGADREATAEDAWQRADLVVLLLSPDYLAERSAQLARARLRHQRAAGQVLPVLVRPCGWENTWLRDLTISPSKSGAALPVKDRRWSSKDEAIKDIADAILARLQRSSSSVLPRGSATAAYVSRPQIQEHILRNLAQRIPAILTGTHRCGKTRLIQRTLEDLTRDAGVRACYLDFTEFGHEDRLAKDRLFHVMATRVAEAVAASPEEADGWVALHFGSNPIPIQRMRRLLERSVLKAPGLQQLVLALDHVNAIENDVLRNDLFGMLRAWCNNVSSGAEPWLKLRLILSATTSLKLDSVKRSALSNAEYEVPVGGLSDDEILAMMEQHKLPSLPATPSGGAEDVKILREEVDGNPYYCSIAIAQAQLLAMTPGRWLRERGRRAFEQDLDCYLTSPFEEDPHVRDLVCKALCSPKQTLEKGEHYRLLRTGLFSHEPQRGYQLIYRLFAEHLQALCRAAATEGPR